MVLALGVWNVVCVTAGVFRSRIVIVSPDSKGSNRLLAGPDIVSRGFVYVRESEGLMEEARKVVTDSLDKCLSEACRLE